MAVQRVAALGEEVYQQLHKMITGGEIPPRVPIREAELVRKIGTSRTPIREALRRLQAENLLTPIPHVGYIVREVGLDRLAEVFQVRGNLEGLAAQLAAMHRTRTDIAHLEDLLDAMDQAVAEGDDDRFYRLNGEFHDTIAKSSGNEYLQSLLLNIRGTYRRFRPNVTYTPSRRLEMQAEHRELKNALAAGDSSRARLLASEHIGRALAFRLKQDRSRIAATDATTE